MMAYKQILVLLLTACFVAGQRPSFAGSRPIGYPDVVTPADPLGNRFGDDSPLPVEAKGDRALVERLSKLPIDKQPFWFINWKAIEEARKNPQTYPQRENSFSGNFLGQPQSANFQASSQSNTGVDAGGLTSKFGETNGASGNLQPGASGNLPSGANSNLPSGANSNFANTFNNNKATQQGYRQYKRQAYYGTY